MRDPMVRLDRVAVGYGGAPLVSGVDFALERGRIVALIGPNGAGKSTILKSVAGQLDLMGGAVYLDGRAMAGMARAEIATKLSVLMTERPHPELMTCEDVVATGRFPYTGRFGILSDDDWRTVRSCLELVHATELAACDFAAVSDGQRQRVMLARALAQDPEVVVLDEPTSFLDIHHKLELLSILKDLVRERDLAVLMSLHELDLAQRVADTVVCVRDGRIDRIGTPDEVFEPAYIAALYGLEQGSYEAAYGSLELGAVRGAPQVLVVGGNGRGIATYRGLRRAGVPFAAGVLHGNDLDVPAARALAAEVVLERAFEPIGDRAFERACTLVETCPQVVCCLGPDDFGLLNARNRDLVERARAQGRLVDADALASGVRHGL